MRIHLTLEQQSAIERAIQCGLIRSVDDLLASALAALAVETATFDQQKAQLAGARIRELRKDVTLDLQGLSLRELAHVAHKY